MDCSELRDVAAELALDLLTGPERAAALSHLETCDECRADVASLAATADDVLALAPAVEPPAGFEWTLLRRLTADRATERPSHARRRMRRRRVVGGLLAAAAVIALVVGLAVSLGSGGPSTTTATMRTQQGAAVGDVSLTSSPASLVVDMHGWQQVVGSYGPGASTQARVEITHRDGTHETLALIPHSASSWQQTLTLHRTHASNAVASVQIVGLDGRLWCSAVFT
jgi:anti-sigma factor RsiW